MNARVLGVLFASIALSAEGVAQSFNMDMSSASGTPSSALGAAAGQPGVWNAVPASSGTVALVDLAGIATAVSSTCLPSTTVYDFYYDNPGTLGDDGSLMDDGCDPTYMGATWTLSGLAPGSYRLFTYAWAPDNASYISRVGVAGSPDPAQTVGGNWPGGYVLGVTHALHHISVGSTGTFSLTVDVAANFATVNGFQLVFDGGFTLLCTPGSAGVMACPCANPPAAYGLGCDNSAATGGASLGASGAALLASDSLQFATAGERASATSILLQGTQHLPAGVVFGQGVRCIGGLLKRLYVVNAAGGSIHVPPPGGPSVSVRSAAVGDTITPGSSRFYTVYYRDPIVLGTCAPQDTFNATNALRIDWQ